MRYAAIRQVREGKCSGGGRSQCKGSVIEEQQGAVPGAEGKGVRRSCILRRWEQCAGPAGHIWDFGFILRVIEEALEGSQSRSDTF